MVEFAALSSLLLSKAPGESVRVSKSDLPELPSEFSSTPFGTPPWLAHPGAFAQYRAPAALHAYETESTWDFHRDQYDPFDDPIGHLLFDAPELAIAAILSLIAGAVTYFVLDQWERRKPSSERRWWLAGLVSIIVALAVAALTYVVGAKLRAAISGG
jgi:hypothetical protein